MMRSVEMKMAPPEMFLRPSMGTLSVKDESENRTAGRDLQIANFMDDPRLEGVVCIFGPGFSEKLPNLVRMDVAPIRDNISYSLLVR